MTGDGVRQCLFFGIIIYMETHGERKTRPKGTRFTMWRGGQDSNLRPRISPR